jgi:hypothetical protein
MNTFYSQEIFSVEFLVNDVWNGLGLINIKEKLKNIL